MSVRRLGWFVPVVLLFAAAARAGGGGPQSVIGVGAGHEARQIRVSTEVAGLLYQGKPTTAPHAGYIRVYPIFFGLPGAPARLFPASGAFCFDPPHAVCSTLPSRAREALGPLARLPLRTHPLTTVRTIRHGRTPLQLGNLAVAIELAFERGGHRAALPGRTTPLRLTWEGPARDARPSKVRVGRRRGLYSRDRVFPLSAAAVAYLRANLG